MERTADVVIIGAGVMGTSTAFQLVQRGVKRVVVLEKSTVAAGSSGKSSALVRMHYTFLPEARLALLSLGWFQEWRERVGGSCGFTKTGFVRLVTPALGATMRRCLRPGAARRAGRRGSRAVAADWRGDPGASAYSHDSAVWASKRLIPCNRRWSRVGRQSAGR